MNYMISLENTLFSLRNASIQGSVILACVKSSLKNSIAWTCYLFL